MDIYRYRRGDDVREFMCRGVCLSSYGPVWKRFDLTKFSLLLPLCYAAAVSWLRNEIWASVWRRQRLTNEARMSLTILVHGQRE